MKGSPLAGKPAELAMLVNMPKLIMAYYTGVTDLSVPEQRVAFGTSGHRGSAFQKAFNEGHIFAISRAICLYRIQQKIDGPLFLRHGHPSPCRPWPAPWRCWRPMGWKAWSPEKMNIRRLRSYPMPFSPIASRPMNSRSDETAKTTKPFKIGPTRNGNADGGETITNRHSQQ